MTFNLQLYQQVWHRLNQSKIVTPAPNAIAKPTYDEIAPIPLQSFNSLDSTNTKAWELVDRGIKTPVAVMALEQTAGKGQWGNSWVSAEGGLYLSVALDVDLDLKDNSHLVMATVWGITKVLRYYQLPVKIKWSNDLILENSKLGGIKIETRNINKRIAKAVVGVGINWKNDVPDMGINLQSYYQERVSVAIDSLEELTAITSYGIILGYQYYQAFGIDSLLAKYTAVLNSIGKEVIIGEYPGEVTGVTKDGKLKVKLKSPGAATEIAFTPGQISLGY